MRSIKTAEIKDTTVTVPGSKSYTHRTLIASALSSGQCRLQNWLDSEDTCFTINALRHFGAGIEKTDSELLILGCGGRPGPCDQPIYLGNSGTSMRLLASYAALGHGPYILKGTKRMHERPMGHLLAALSQVGISAVSLNGNDCPPVSITGGPMAGGAVHINCSQSSQFLSGLLLAAPCTKKGLSIQVTHGMVSRPYIDMTIDIMARFGIQLLRKGYDYFEVPGGQQYQAGRYQVEPDASQAGYFWAAAAITARSIKVRGITEDSVQGDVRFCRVLETMGCHVNADADGITVTGGELSGIDVDMADMPDIVPTLAVVAAFARGVTRIRNVAHLKIKESDRLSAVIAELTKMKISARAENDDLIITGGTPTGAVVETYNDHRMAMCFAIAGLKTPGMVISNEMCVEKSFPTFWEVLEGLYRA